jgi:hypothetical protein
LKHLSTVTVQAVPQKRYAEKLIEELKAGME